MFWHDKLADCSDELILCTDDGSAGRPGFVDAALRDVLARETADLVVAIGPMPMMHACAEASRPFGVRTMVSLNTIMVDGTGMCGSCRVTVGGEVKFACVDGPDFDGHAVDFKELHARQKRFKRQEEQANEDHAHVCSLEELLVVQGKRTYKKYSALERVQVKMPERDAAERAAQLRGGEPRLRLCRGAARGRALHPVRQADLHRGLPGAHRHPDLHPPPAAARHRGGRGHHPRVQPVPVGVRPRLPAGEPVRGAVRAGQGQDGAGGDRPPGALRRRPRQAAAGAPPVFERTLGKVAIVGSGPGGLAAAADLLKYGADVTVFEALHVVGGVLRYGIPSFRLPRDIIEREVQQLRDAGLKFETNKVIGKTFTIAQLTGAMGFDAVFVAAGAGAPAFLGIPGEFAGQVYSANEFLTRVNLMGGDRFPYRDTPISVGERVVVIGAGNTAMDCLRVAKRLGAAEVRCVYRRSEAEAPARIEELRHAREEGIEFSFLHGPVEILLDDEGDVRGLRAQKMTLGEPDERGRRTPLPLPEFVEWPCDTVIYALGTKANPIVGQATRGLALDKRGYIVADEATQSTNLPGVFAGGDIVTGGATVILAMAAGRRAARAIGAWLQQGKGGWPVDAGRRRGLQRRRPPSPNP